MQKRKYLLTLLVALSGFGFTHEKYTVSSSGNLLVVQGSTGTRVFFADPGFESLRNYRLEIPLADLKQEYPRDSSKDKKDQSKTGDYAELDDEALITTANQLYYKGKVAEALKYTEELNRRNPGHVRGWMMRGSLLHAMGEKELAKSAWQKALELDPENKDIKKILGGYR